MRVIEPVDALEKGLPCNLDIERWVLGSILRDGTGFAGLSELDPADFALEKHRRIFDAIHRLHEEGKPINYCTVYDHLKLTHGTEGCDGIGGLTELSTGVPERVPLDAQQSCVRLLLNKSTDRQAIFAAEHVRNLLLNNIGTPGEALAAHLVLIQELSQRGGGAGQTIADIPSILNCGKTAVEYLREPELPRHALVALTGDSGSGKSTLASAWAGEAAAAGIPVLILDRENPLSVVAERLRRLGITDGPMFKYCGGWLEQGVPGPDSAAVIDWVKSCEPRPLVIVDSMAAFHGGDENDAGDTRAFMQQCRTLVDLGATVILIHHEGKADTAKDYRGSSDFKAAVDVAFHVSNFPGPDGRLGMIRLRCYKSRLGFAGELIYHYRDGRFERGQGREAFKTVVEQLTAILRENPGIDGKSLDKRCTAAGLGRDRCRELLKTWEGLGKVRILKGEKNRSEYYLADALARPSVGDLAL